MFLLVLFAYHETPVAKQNLQYFQARGLLPPDSGRHVFVLNGAHTVDVDTLAAQGNVAVVERENRCFDFGAWGVGLGAADDAFGGGDAAYTHVVFMNASVRGPFLSSFEVRPWWAVFADQLGGPGNVGLVGTSLNCWSSLQESHLQSMFLVFSAASLRDVVLPSGALDCKADHDAAVFGGEIPLSRAFLDAGYSLKTQLRAFDRLLPFPGVVTPAAARAEGPEGARLYELCVGLLQTNGHGGDLLYPGEYGGTDVHPLEVVFAKTGRGVSAAALDAYTRWAVD